jgi:3-oxoacyl-(acyl-carrier-protein) synthase
VTGAARPVITAWSAISPFGVGAAAFAAGLREGRLTATAPDRAQWQVPDERACLVSGFDPRQALGRKGTRSMNRVTGLAVATVGDLLDKLGEAEPDRDRTALVLGTTTGSLQSTMAFTRGSLTGERPYHVDAALIPYAVMNGAAAQCAIWHGLKGPNTTFASGRPTGLVSLSYARRLLLTGRAATVLCGGAEEYSSARSRVDALSRAEPAVLGEGCAMFALTLAPAPGHARPETGALASVVAVESRVCAGGDWRPAVQACVHRVLAAAGPSAAGDVGAAVPSGVPGEAGQAERGVLAEVFGGAVVRPVTDLIGETHAASASFQIAAVLSLWAAGPAPAGPLAVLTSVDPGGGQVAAALLRMGPDLT